MSNRRSVFLSHTGKDVEIIESVAKYLEDNEIPCWYAPRNIPFGQHHNIRIPTDIEYAEVVLVFITENVGDSEYVPKEITLAIDYKKTIIPILIDGSPIPKSLKLFLCNVQWIDKSAYEKEEDFLENLAAILEEVYQENLEGDTRSAIAKQPVVLKNSSNSLLFEITAPTLCKAEKVFVPPTGILGLQDKLKSQHIIYIHHLQHVGKYTAALSLFREMGTDKVYEWSKEASFLKITQHPLKHGVGFIAEIGASAEFFKGMQERDIENYIEKLEERNAYLILIGKDEPLPVLQSYSDNIKPPSDIEELLMRHVSFMEIDDRLQQDIIQWIKSPEGKKITPEVMLPRETQPFLHKVKKLVMGQISKKDLNESLDINVRERVKVWFKHQNQEPRSLKEVAFYLALGIFKKHTYPVVVENSRQLLMLLLEHLGKELVLEEEKLGRDEYLSHFHAHVKKTWVYTDIGEEEVDVVSFYFREDAPVIWEYVWKQHPIYNEPLIKWLQKLLSQGNLLLNESMKAILIHLLKKDFQSVRNRIILPWANSAKPKERLFAAKILHEFAKDEERTHSVFNLANSWASTTNNNRLQWTAVVLLGKELGFSYLPQSLRLLRKVYERNKGKMGFSVQRSFETISETVLYGNHYEKLYFRFWIEWFSETSRNETHEVMRFSQSIFAKFPQVFFRTDSEWNEEFWIKLVCMSLTNMITRKSLEEMLEAWVAYSSKEASYREKLAVLLYSVYTFENQNGKDYLVRFINKGIKRQKLLYAPIQDRLLTM